MRKTAFLAVSLIGLGAALGGFGPFDRPQASNRWQTSPYSERVNVRASSRSSPWVNLSDGRDLLVDYQGSLEAVRTLVNGSVRATGLASADFDENGVVDLICGYATPDGAGLVVLHRGNVDAVYPNTPQAQLRRPNGEVDQARFLSPALAFEIPDAPDFIGAGDFNGDGHCDLVAAARGGQALWMLRGDGLGGFAAGEIALPGQVSALIAGDINRADGLEDVIVGVVASDGPKLLVFESPEGAWSATPEVLTLPAAASALALGQLDEAYPIDVAVGAGSELLIFPGDEDGLTAPSRRSLSFGISSVAVGNFDGSPKNELALASDAGDVYVLGNQSAQLQASVLSGSKLARRRGSQAVLIPANVSSLPGEDLLVLEPGQPELRVINLGAGPGARTVVADSDSDLAAVIPMRLNSDGLSDLVVLGSARTEPAILLTAPAAIFTVTSASDSGAGSLRDAITNANANAGPDNIVFSIASGPQTISPSSPLPAILEAVTIDGTTQPGFAGLPIIELDGSAAGAGADGISLRAPDCVVRGLLVNDFSNAGISLAADRSTIEGCFIGTNLAGAAAAGNLFGVFVSSSNNVIGGTTSSARNLISGNMVGVLFEGSGVADNRLEGNFIGTAVAGVGAVPNTAFGVRVDGLGANSASGNRIGRPVAGARNLISANTDGGVLIDGPGASGNLVQGNFIGTEVTGTDNLSNGGAGVLVSGVSNTIGGTTVAARNLISGNLASGVDLADAASGNLVRGNFIGTDITGAADVPNAGDGVSISSGANNNVIGGAVPGAANVIAFNLARGVSVIGASTIRNAISSNSIFSNTDLGIDLGNDGVTANDAGDVDTGPNELQNFPLLTSVTSVSGTTVVTGSLSSRPFISYRVEFFSSASCDASGNGEGAMFIGATTVTTNGSGVASILSSFPVGLSPGSVVTSTATDPIGNTSEFSPCTVVTLPPCSISCPSSVTVPAGPTQCGANVSFSVTTVGSCGPVTCIPPSGSLFSVGTTNVTCTAFVGPTCSFPVTVVDTTPPALTCPADVVTTLPPGKSSATVTYPAPAVSDNCGQATVQCSPPSGGTFPFGVTFVTCVAFDPDNNVSQCFFTVRVNDAEPPVIACPANVVLEVGPTQTSAVVNYPAPTVTDNVPGATGACVPPSGSTFPLGTTTVTCTASDVAGNRASCSFTVTINGGPPRATVIIESGKPTLEFGAVPARRKTKKKSTPDCFLIRNDGFTPLVLTLQSILRTGPDVDRGRITDRDDRTLFLISLVNADGTQTPASIGNVFRVGLRQQARFCVRFNPLIPAETGATTGLRATDVVPNVVTSTLNFALANGNPIAIGVVGRVRTALVLINGAEPRRPPLLTLSRSGNEFIVKFSIHDSNLDTNRVKYEFLTGDGRVVQVVDNVDLTGPISQRNLTTGQSFSIEHTFTGASANPAVTRVRVMVTDGEASVTGEASLLATAAAVTQQVQRAGVTVVPLPIRLGPHLP